MNTRRALHVTANEGDEIHAKLIYCGPIGSSFDFDWATPFVGWLFRLLIKLSRHFMQHTQRWNNLNDIQRFYLFQILFVSN